ncbi:hypothetical protein Scep_028564 [Stephania cephalantha]|uniref:Uncharacterized protein n=1 Tax=Stephania cephalantha TaxID=152367 RepID=A0AAP0EDD9_9MAGN
MVEFLDMSQIICSNRLGFEVFVFFRVQLGEIFDFRDFVLLDLVGVGSDD